MPIKKYVVTLLVLCIIYPPFVAIAQKRTPPTAKQQEQYYKNGLALYRKEKYAEAVPLLEYGVGKRFASPDLPYWLGVSYCQTSNFDKAKPLLLKTLKRNSLANYYLAISYSFLREYTEAFATAELALANKSLTKSQIKNMNDVKAHAQTCLLMVQNVDDIEVIDSLVVSKKEFFKHYQLGCESGTIYPNSTIFGQDSTYLQSVHENQKQTRIIYAKLGSTGTFDLKSAYRLNDKFEEGVSLKGPINSLSNDIQPFLMADGVTIYFASDREGGVGGYDIYISRYNINSESYLLPENVGMPYNSEYNDYLMAIDEVNKIGWFASDRYQKPGDVVIYIFEYQAERRKISDAVRASKAATLRSIRHTQREGKDYAQRRKQIEMLKPNVADDKQMSISFVVNDSLMYSSVDDFKSAHSPIMWSNLNKKIIRAASLVEQLKQDRTDYAIATSNGKPTGELSIAIHRKEEELNELYSQIKLEQKNLRNEENSLIHRSK